MKIAIMSPMWKRLKLTNYIFGYYNRLKASLAPTIKLVLIAVGSEGGISRGIAERNGYDYIECPNKPLNRKHNAAARYSKRHNPDVLINMNSDSIISAEYFRAIDPKSKTVMGLRDLWILDLYSKRLGYWPGYIRRGRKGEPAGPGRCFSREILKKCNWQPWKQNMSLNYCLDGNCRDKLKSLGIGFASHKMSETNCFAMDVKSSVNITSWHAFVSSYKGVLAGDKVIKLLEKFEVADIFEKVVHG